MSLDQARAPYLEALVAYAARRPARFHVPGHKGGPAADAGALMAFGEAAFAHDIPTLIEGIDIGPEPTPFQQAQLLAADAWGAQRSWFLGNGASQGNHAACIAVAQKGKRVVVQRNVHSSTVDGIVMAGLEPSFAAPELDPELGIAHCLTPEALRAVLDATPGASAVFVVSPTYFGAAADVAALAEVAHARGAALVADESWGAHLRFCDRLPGSALAGGADIALSSVHKLAGSLTQSAVLHLGSDERIDEGTLDRAVTLTESTSPSGLLAGSVDAARRQAAVDGERLLAEMVDALAETRERVRATPGFDVLDERLAGRRSVHAWDPLRLSIDVRGTGVSGRRVAALMLASHDVNLELVSENVLVAVFGLGEDVRTSSEVLLAALEAAARALGEEEHSDVAPFAPPPPWGPLAMSPREAFLGPQEPIELAAAEGRVAAESLAAYPPGVPNVLPGEELTRETLAYIREVLDTGGQVRGAVDRTLRTIRVVSE